MNNILVVIDMQNDFIDGALGTAEAVSIVGPVESKIRNFEGKVFFTRDVHHENYLSTQEGRLLPVPHCIEGTDGCRIRPSVDELRTTEVIDKPGFGSPELIELLKEINAAEPITGITYIGLCTDICVITNALMAKAFFPEIPVTVDAACCAGVSHDSHCNALMAMKSCQIDIINWIR